MAYRTLQIEPMGLSVAYHRRGHGEPLLYCHPILSTPTGDPLLEALAMAFDVMAPYAPGWGPSTDLETLAGPLDVALFYHDFLQALHIGSAHLLGISIGAWMAAELAAIFPERVRKLVLVNPMGIWREEIPGADPFAQHPLRPTEVLFAEPTLRERLLLHGRDHTEVYLHEVHDLKAAARFLWPIPDTGVAKRLRRISAPTLIVVSERDKVVVPAYGSLWQQAIAGARLTTMAGAGHLANLEQPEVLAQVATAFLQERDGSV